MARTGAGPLIAEERLTVTQRAAGRAGVFDAVVQAIEPPHRFVVAGHDAEGVTIAIEADVRPADNGGSRRGARSSHGQLRDRHPRDQRPRAPAGCGHQPPR